MKPKEEIANLKASWTKDPSWNIEDIDEKQLTLIIETKQ